MPGAEPVVSLRGVVKDYRGLRPLRIAALKLADGQRLALLGLDQAMAEVLVKLIMGASVPDSGEVIVFGQSTAAIADGDTWLDGLDRFGLLSDRTLLVDQLTAEQTLAMPISFDVDEPTGEVRRAVQRVADEVGLETASLSQPVGALPPLARARVRLGRVLIAKPRLLLGEHPTASLSPDDTNRFTVDVCRVVRDRRLTALVMTADRGFANAMADEVVTLRPATGALESASRWRRWLQG